MVTLFLPVLLECSAETSLITCENIALINPVLSVVAISDGNSLITCEKIICPCAKKEEAQFSFSCCKACALLP